jgi:hypothetical protein
VSGPSSAVAGQSFIITVERLAGSPSITLITAGTQTVTITDLTRGSVIAVVLTIQVDLGQPVGFRVSQAAGTAHGPRMRAEGFVAGSFLNYRIDRQRN